MVLTVCALLLLGSSIMVQQAEGPEAQSTAPQVFVREASMVPVYALLLFGGSIVIKHAEGLLHVDGWVLKAPARIAVLVRSPVHAS